MDEQHVTFPSGNLTLAGTYTQSQEPRPSPAVLLIAGSGPIDRDSNVKRLPLGVTRDIAHHLSAAGVASLRFDKRGVGASQGDYHSAGLYDNVADASAAFKFLRQRPEVDPARVFLVGHSEGALIAVKLAGSGAATAGVVLLAGAAQTGEEVLQWQGAQVANYLPVPVRFLLKLMRTDVTRSQAKRLEKIKTSTADVMRAQVFVKLNAKWFREFMAFDPSPEFRKTRVPILAITGSDDIQVDPADIERMRQLTEAPFEGHVIPGVNHILRTGGPSPTTYKKQMRLPLDSRVVDLLSDWLNRQSAAVVDEPEQAQATGPT